jgi:hypothetical protein
MLRSDPGQRLTEDSHAPGTGHSCNSGSKFADRHRLHTLNHCAELPQALFFPISRGWGRDPGGKWDKCHILG